MDFASQYILYKGFTKIKTPYIKRMSGIYNLFRGRGKPNSQSSSKSSSKSSPTSSKSPNSNSKSPRSKYAKKMYTMLGTTPKGIDEVNRVFLMDGVTDKIYKYYKNSLKYLVDGISLDNLNLEYLALNPRLPNSLIKDIIKLIGDDEYSLRWFYHNLAKNKNPKVFSILRKEYRDNPDSDKLEWKALSRNPNAISILMKEYELNPNRIDFNALSSNTHRDAIKLLERKIVVENQYLPDVFAEFKSYHKVINWFSLSANPNAIKLIREEYERKYKKDSLSNRIDLDELSKHPKISKLKDILIEKTNFNKLEMRYLASNPFAPVELLNNINRKFVFLADNPNLYVINLMREEYEKEHSTRNIKWSPLSASTIPEAIKLLRDIIEYEIKENEKVTDPIYKRHKISVYQWYINFKTLSANPTDEAVLLLKEYIDIELAYGGGKIKNVDWDALSSNPHPIAIELLRNKIAREREKVYDKRFGANIGKDRINWGNISANIGAIELIIEKLKKETLGISTYDEIYKIDKNKLSMNPAIFVDYDILTRKSATKK
jgi:hypothetical protein